MKDEFKMNEIYHHGILNQKWGVRRYQNPDGTLTAEGRARYSSEARANSWKIGEDGVARSTGKKNAGEIHEADPNKWVKEDITRTKKVVDESTSLVKTAQNVNHSSSRNTKKQKRMDLSHMTDKEMRDKINRELIERQYNDVFNPPKQKKGKKFVGGILDAGGTALVTTSSALGIALALKELRG